MKKDEYLLEQFRIFDSQLSRIVVKLMLYLGNVDIDNNKIDFYYQLVYNVLFHFLKKSVGDDIYQKIKGLL